MIKWLFNKFFIKNKLDVPMNLNFNISEYDLNIPIDRIINNYDKNKKNILIIDDSRGIVSVIEDFINEVQRNKSINLSEYNILTFYGKYSSFVLEKTLNVLSPITIDYAIIDIVLPGKIKRNNETVKMDGIDISILLNSQYNCNNFCFFTGNVVSEHIEYINEKVVKFSDFFNTDIRNYIIFKGDKDGSETINKLSKLFDKTMYSVK